MTPKLLRAPSATMRSAKASSSAAVAPGSVVSARLCRDDVPTWPSRVPRPNPACCTSQAALSLTCPSPAGQLGQPSTARAAGDDRVGEEAAGAAAVGVGRVEHHALAAAQLEHGLADVRQRGRLAELDAQPPGQLGVADRSRRRRSRRASKVTVEDDEPPGLPLEPAVAVGEPALGRGQRALGLLGAVVARGRR